MGGNFHRGFESLPLRFARGRNFLARAGFARSMRRLAAAVLVIALAGCAPVGAPGATSKIELVGTQVVDGYSFDLYRNLAYPCSIRGYQTFVIGTKVGSSATAERPLWVRMHGGGVGFFAPDGSPQPDAAHKSEEGQVLENSVSQEGLVARVRSDPAGFRLLSVSMCDHDIYAGGNLPDPNNPNTLPDGSPRTVNGLYATKAAIQIALGKVPTSKFFLHGTSAGGSGVWSVAYGLEEQGLAPAGAVADSGVINYEWQQALNQQLPTANCARPQAALDLIKARLHPTLTTQGNQPDQLVSRGELTVPVLHVWNQADHVSCGATPMQCPLRDGTTITLGAGDCHHEPMRRAIAALGPGSRSVNMQLCASLPQNAGTCTVHTPTNNDNLVNTNPAWPADYNTAAMDWVRERLSD